MGLIIKIPVYAEKIPGGGIITTSLETVLHQAQAKSLWYLLFGTACCAIELMATGAAQGATGGLANYLASAKEALQ